MLLPPRRLLPLPILSPTPLRGFANTVRISSADLKLLIAHQEVVVTLVVMVALEVSRIMNFRKN